VPSVGDLLDMALKVSNSRKRRASSAAAEYTDEKYRGRGSDALENM
jgi:hypothetical protein